MRQLAKAWFDVGTQSVGGGTSTLSLIRRIVVERHAWLTLREFNEAWALSQLSPGIHLVALAGMLGQRIAGIAGVLVSVGGMMIPAAVITALMTAAYGTISESALAHAALAGMGPATGGMTLAQALLLTRDVRQRGRRVIGDVAVVVVAFALLAFTGVSPIAVIVAGSAFGAVALRRERPTSERAES